MLLQGGDRAEGGQGAVCLGGDAQPTAETTPALWASTPGLRKELLGSRTGGNLSLPLPSPPSALDWEEGSVYLPRM